MKMRRVGIVTASSMSGGLVGLGSICCQPGTHTPTADSLTANAPRSNSSRARSSAVNDARDVDCSA
jgi:hypothetical protein